MLSMWQSLAEGEGPGLPGPTAHSHAVCTCLLWTRLFLWLQSPYLGCEHCSLCCFPAMKSLISALRGKRSCRGCPECDFSVLLQK